MEHEPHDVTDDDAIEFNDLSDGAQVENPGALAGFEIGAGEGRSEPTR